MNIERFKQIYDLFDHQLFGQVPEPVLPVLMDWGIIPRQGKYLCRNGHPLNLVKQNNCDGWIWSCWKILSKNKKKSAKCNSQVTFRKGTIFEGSHLSVCQILMFAYLWTKNVPLDFIMSECEIRGIHTGVDWNNFCREVVVFGSFQTNLRIGGPGVIVEIDESKLGHRKHNKGHHVEGQWVFGGVESISGKCFMVPVEDRTHEALLPLIKKHIMPGSTIISDFWRTCNTLDEEGYFHNKVNHTVSAVNEHGERPNTIEDLWVHLKASVPEYNRRKHFFNGYIQKCIFLRWCRSNSKNEFTEFLRLAGLMYNPINPQENLEEMKALAAEEELVPEYDSDTPT